MTARARWIGELSTTTKTAASVLPDSFFRNSMNAAAVQVPEKASKYRAPFGVTAEIMFTVTRRLDARFKSLNVGLQSRVGWSAG